MEEVWIPLFSPTLKHLGRVQVLSLSKLYMCYKICTIDALKIPGVAGLWGSGVVARILRSFRCCIFMTLINTWQLLLSEVSNPSVKKGGMVLSEAETGRGWAIACLLCLFVTILLKHNFLRDLLNYLVLDDVLHLRVCL